MAFSLQGMLGSSDSVTANFLTQVYPAIGALLETPLGLCATLYWALYGYKVYAGHAPVDMSELLKKTVMTVCLFAALRWSGLGSVVYSAFTGFMEATAATIMAGQPTATMLDALWFNVGGVAATLMKADFYSFGVLIEGGILFVVNCILFIIALFYMIIAKFGLAICMCLMPLFIGFLLFAETKQWFMNWVSKMLNFTFIYILVIAIVRFGFLAFKEAIDAAGAATSIASAAGITVQEIAQLIVVEGVLIIFMLQVKGWAAALSGGAAVQGASVIALAARSLNVKGSK